LRVLTGRRVAAAFILLGVLSGALLIVPTSIPAAAAAGLVGCVLGAIYLRSASKRMQLLVLGAVIALAMVLPQALVVVREGRDAVVHDGILLTDAAADRLLRGQDPYGHDYIDSAAVRRFFVFEAPVNWGLGHYVYPPGPILVDTPLRLLFGSASNLTWLWPALVIPLGVVAYWLGEPSRRGQLFVIAVLLNPFLF
jgi:hypothetical protein